MAQEIIRELQKLFQNVEAENKLNRFKIKIRPSSTEGKFSIHLQKNDGKKRFSRSLKLFMYNNRKKMQHNKDQLEIAKAIRKKLALQLFENENDINLGKFKQSEDFLSYFQRIVEEKRPQGNYRITRNHFINFLKRKDISFNKMTHELCRNFVQYLVDNMRTRRTAHNYLICFKAVLNMAVRDRKMSENPANGLSIKYEKHERARLNFNELQKLSSAPCSNQQLKNAFIFSCYTGLRSSDLLNLTYSNIHGDYLEIMMQKTKKTIRIRLADTAKKILEEQRDLINKSIVHAKQTKNPIDEDRVFCFQKSGRGSRQLKEWLLAAGLIQRVDSPKAKSYTFHTARHTFVSMIINAGNSAYIAKELVGHEDIKTTQLYSHLDDEQKDNAIKSLPELDS